MPIPIMAAGSMIWLWAIWLWAIRLWAIRLCVPLSPT
jgi:hypothetical protein